jgi:hypothetical protein
MQEEDGEVTVILVSACSVSSTIIGDFFIISLIP